MKKFVFVYYNDSDPTEGGMDKGVMEAWNKWFGELGDKLVDGGNPLAPGMAHQKNGVSVITNHPATGYSIINAADMDEATSVAKNCPVLNQPGGAVRVYEAVPM